MWLADFGYFVRLRPFLALHDLKLNNVALLKGFKPFTLNCRIMHEDVSSTILADEAVPFAVVEPFHFALNSRHVPYSERPPANAATGPCRGPI